MPSLMWFRRDLRLLDNPALLAALLAARSGDSAADGRVIPLFIVDPVLWGAAGPVRQGYLSAALAALDNSLGGNLLIRQGNPIDCIPEVVAATGASSVHIAADFGPYGNQRDTGVEIALGTVPLIRTGSPYAVAPGRVTKDDGTPYRVYTPYFRGWL
ncbi:MAG: deoxyribodipyrimidine photo-lyase, partial [Actinomycetota bacterium]|nr:deoxyribodipyrimidine photo-lyase [Actinomycetota bacterium]